MFICEICGITHGNEESELCNVCASSTPAKAKKEAAEKHPDHKLTQPKLLAKAKRLISSQEYTINKHGDSIDVDESMVVVKMGHKLFKGKTTKAKLLALITANSNASRSVNNQLNK